MMEAPQVVSARALYPSDIQLPKMLYGKILRSPHPHARILSIDISEAEKLSGVKAVITGRDLPDVRFGSAISERYILARDVVRFVGESIAAVAAIDADTAERATKAIKVKYEMLPAVYDAEEALKPGTRTIVHPDFESYSSKSSALVYSARIPKGIPNVTNSFSVKRGDVEKGFAEADFIVENRFSTSFGQHCPLEPHTSVAQSMPDGSVTIWTGCALPFRIVKQVSETLQIPLAKVRVMQSMIGGSYGAKNNMEVEPICAALSFKTSCPVKIVLTRKEEFLTVVRHPFVVYVKDGIKKNGAIVARKVRCYLNGGAYSGGSGNAVARNCVFGITDAYNIPNLSVDSYRAYTNLPPAGAYRGFGTPQVLWAIEQQMDILAYKIGIDPVELRRRNLLQDGDISGLGEHVHNFPIKECLAKAAEAIRWKEPAKVVGDWHIAKGIAVASKYSQAPTTSVAEVKLYSDGSINVMVSTVDSGQGIRTAMAVVAAESLQVPMEKIQITFPDTAYTPYDDGNISSRGTFNVGNAVKLACEDLKRQIIRAASQRLGCDMNDLTISNGKVLNKSSGKFLVFAELFSARLSSVPLMVGEEGEFVGKGTWMVRTSKMDPETSQPVDLDDGDERVRICSFYTPGAQAVEIAVNIRTGELRVLKVVTVADAGRAINKSAVESQLNGAAIMGLGLALSEEMVFEDGKLLNSGFLDYRLLTSLDAPEFVAIVVESNQRDGPFGAKGVGEIGIVAIGAALANAIHNAIGVRLWNSPITTKVIIDALIEKEVANRKEGKLASAV